MNVLPLTVKGVTKHFGAVVALAGVDLSVQPGECLAVVGENGAGKSTLMKILAGVERPDEGYILFNGRPTVINNPRHAQDLGVCLVHQELQFIPQMSVVENIFLGREKTQAGLLRSGPEEGRAREALAELGLETDLRQPMSSLSVAEQQLVEIAKGLCRDAELIIMDEPTAALAPAEVERLFRVIRGLLSRQKGVIYISHRIDEITRIADRVLVLRDGQVAGLLPAAADSHKVVALMIGRQIEEFYPKTTHARGQVVLEGRNLHAHGVHDVSFELHSGEILGIGGLVGAGQRELADVLYGRTRPSAGEIRIHGHVDSRLTPARAIANGLAFVGEDRRREGLNLKASIKDNITLPVLSRVSRWGLLSLRRLASLVLEQMKWLRIRARSIEQEVTELSGGNQQKVVVARAMVSDPSILILVEPTRGVDVGARVEIYELLDRFAIEGRAVLMVSSDLNELRGMSDRILILCKGRVAGELDQAQATRENLAMLATGQSIQA